MARTAADGFWLLVRASARTIRRWPGALPWLATVPAAVLILIGSTAAGRCETDPVKGEATFSAAGGKRAGEAGDGLMLSRTQPRPKERPKASLAELQHPIIDAYLAALPRGRDPRIMASRTLFVADDRKDALRFADIGLRRVVDHFVDIGFVPPGLSLPELIAALDVHVGTPEDVIASLSADSTLDRVTDLVFQVHSVDPPHAHILRSIELTAKTVAPALGWEEAKAAKGNRVALAT